MLHKIDENAVSTATLTSTSNSTTAATTISSTTAIMASTETAGNGTEPTISTHLAIATATIEPTSTTTSTSATEQETVAIVVDTSTAVGAVAADAAAAAAVEGQATETMTANNSSPPLPLPAEIECTELATTADVADAAAAAAAAASTSASCINDANIAGEPRAAIEPTFDVQMRTQQQQKIRIYHGAKQSAVWRTDSLASNSSSNRSDAGSTETIASSRSIGGGAYATAPSLLQRKFSDSSFSARAMPRRVSFPESDKELVTGYLEPANPWEKVCQVSSKAEIIELYVKSCNKHQTVPLEPILKHLQEIDLSLVRQPLLSLKGIELTANDCEPLEELFMRIQYKAIDLSECPLDESCLSALCQMIEYYEAANELDISYNKEQMTPRGWSFCTHMIGRSQELQLLNAEKNQISKVGAENLGTALSTSNLHTLKLEHCGLKGPPLTNFCCKLYHNKVLKELWLGYNDLDCTDAQHIADMLRFNHSIELIDISNNNIRNEGVMYLVQALILQATELERRSGLPLQRARAIEDDDLVSPLETTAPVQLASVIEQSPTAAASTNTTYPRSSELAEIAGEQEKSTPVVAVVPATIVTTTAALEQPCTSEPAVAVLVDVENDADDDNTEDTVRTLRGGNQGVTGRSMLDKLLSMNSDSSIEEAPSNISTDTLAACCSEDISEISNDIYESADKTMPAAAADLGPTSKDECATMPATANMSVPCLLSPSAEQLTTAIQPEQQPPHSSQTERNLCDITPSTEAKTVEPNETCVQNNNNANSHNNNNNNNNNNMNNNNHNNNGVVDQIGASEVAGCASASASIYEVTPEESDCINGIAGPSGSKPLDMNKNAKAGDDFEDTHSTDSAFESASEGDISRQLPDEFSRLSVSLESTRLDEIAKEMAIETATIASESTECLLVAEEAVTPISTSADAVHDVVQMESVLPEVIVATAAPEVIVVTAAPEVIVATAAPKVTIAAMDKESSTSPCPSPTPTPPPPSTSPGGVSCGLRRIETSCAYLNQSTRNRSQSSDSLCSENSLDGSTSAADPHLAEKLTKNDTLSRRHLTDATLDAANRAPSGLKALALWSNNLTKECGPWIADLLSRSSSLELLNIGKNCLSNDFVATIKDALIKNKTLTTLGLQSAHLSAKGIETLASILANGGNNKLQRIDIRDNKLEVESLNIIAEVLKSNQTITQIDINDEPKRLTIGSDAHLDYTRVLGTVRSMCSRNEQMQAEEMERAANVGGVGGNNIHSISNGGNGTVSGSNMKRCRNGYYLGSRKISLTCHSRPLVDTATGTVTAALAVTAMPTPAAKLEVKRKTNTRLRSPGPSPPTISPSSSPNRSRFHVSRVNEIGSPLTSPLAQMPPQHPHTPRSASSCMSIPSATSVSSCSNGDVGSCSGSQSSLNAIAALPLPTSSSLPSMASVTSSTQTIKRLSVSPRSRFHVSRIYEDPHTPPINLPPTPMLKSARKAAAQLAEAYNAVAVTPDSTAADTSSTTTPAATTTTTSAMPISSVIIVEPTPTAAENEKDAQHQQSTNGESLTAQKLSPNSPSTSSSSCSTSPVSSATSSSSSSSSTTDFTDSSSSIGPAAAETAIKSCPIAVFGDNDITLTKDSAVGAALSAAATIDSDSSKTFIETTANVAVSAQNQQQQQQQQQQPPVTRARKSSWIANPTTVDKLLTLFNPTTIFQRSSSPDSKASALPASTATSLASNAQSTTTNTTAANSGDVMLLATRKTTPPSRCNNGNGNYSTTAAGSLSAGVSSGSGSSGAFGLEICASGASFLDTASRQLRDLKKQVFRPNLSFNISSDGAGTAAGQLDTNAGTVATGISPILSNVAESPSPPERNAAHMPSSLKRELKENISPEHTINEETLQTLQKISRVEDMALKAEAAAELGDIEIVMHSEVSDMIEIDMPQPHQQQQQTQQQQSQQQQQDDLGAGLGH